MEKFSILSKFFFFGGGEAEHVCFFGFWQQRQSEQPISTGLEESRSSSRLKCTVCQPEC